MGYVAQLAADFTRLRRSLPALFSTFLGGYLQFAAAQGLWELGHKNCSSLACETESFVSVELFSLTSGTMS
jgi:hypothetical protein